MSRRLLVQIPRLAGKLGNGRHKQPIGPLSIALNFLGMLLGDLPVLTIDGFHQHTCRQKDKQG